MSKAKDKAKDRAAKMSNQEILDLKDVIYANLATKWQRAVYRAAWQLGRINRG